MGWPARMVGASMATAGLAALRQTWTLDREETGAQVLTIVAGVVFAGAGVWVALG